MLPVIPDHLGDLHPFEQALVAAMAFGPFLVLAVVIYVVRKRDLAAEALEAASRPDGEQPANPDGEAF